MRTAKAQISLRILQSDLGLHSPLTIIRSYGMNEWMESKGPDDTLRTMLCAFS